ncbi:hypothetical protein SKAU_G00119420 [Synaphobranchus kaupii]|uniref:Uncharacterized protein n=1 Tax=Synaphobranchus kaupii TaxID=118154 RepID=A0A9Q1J1W5_SYNKA|nr:hypothetical protein SKAU_G00119420 [Synaphobranchus kaupii]
MYAVRTGLGCRTDWTSVYKTPPLPSQALPPPCTAFTLALVCQYTREQVEHGVCTNSPQSEIAWMSYFTLCFSKQHFCR